ncbi:hypothetical protein NUM3379_40860 [Kineococcus sp. NUM-3379]
MTSLAALGVTGCSVFSPVQTTYVYEPGDGYSTQVGEVLVRNAVVVSEGEGTPGVLSATLVNNSDEEAEITITPEGGSATTVEVPVGVAVVLSRGDASPGATEQLPEPLPGDAEPAFIQLGSVDAVPGELVTVSLESGGQSVELGAPVLLPRHEYAPYTPTPTDTPTGTATGAADEPTSPADRTDNTQDPEPIETSGEPTATSGVTQNPGGN